MVKQSRRPKILGHKVTQTLLLGQKSFRIVLGENVVQSLTPWSKSHTEPNHLVKMSHRVKPLGLKVAHSVAP